jgi:hypothetical protein
MTGKLSRGSARWKYNTGEDAGLVQIDEKTLEALLQLGIAYIVWLRSIGGRGLMLTVLAVIYSSVKYHSVLRYTLTITDKNVKGQYLVGSFVGATSS